MLAAALVIITATVSFQHDTPPQAAYADPGDFLFNINSNNPKPDPITGKGPTIDGAYSKVEINSYGWVYVLHQNKGTIDKYPPADYDESSLKYARTIMGLNNPHHFDIDSVDGNLVVLNYDGAGNPQIKILDHNGGQLRTIGGAGHAHLVDPQDVAVSYSANKIYVIDKVSATDSNYARIIIYNYATGAFIDEFGLHGNAYANWHAAEYRYNFNVLDAIATNPDGDIIVADRTTPGSGSPDSDTRSRIMVYDQYGKWKRTVFPVDDACDPKSFFRVYDIDTDAYGNMFIGDRYRVMVLDPTGRLLSHFWGVGNPPLTDSTSQGNIYHEELNRAGDDEIPVWSVAVGPHQTPEETPLEDDVIIIGQIPEGSAPLNNMLVFEGLPLDYNERAMDTFLAENPLPCAIPDSLSLLRDDDGHVIEDMIYTPKKGPVDLAFNSTGWMFVPNRVIIYPVWEQGLCVNQYDENRILIENWTGWWNNSTGKTLCRDKSETVPDERIDLMYEHANTVSIFDPDGNHVKTIGSRGSPKENTNYYFLCEVQDPDRVNKSNWKNKYCWWKPMDVTVDANDNIYVTSAIHGVDIQIYDPNWKFIKYINTNRDTKATVAWGIDVGGPNNYVYSTHQGHNVISVFDPHIDDPYKLAERIYMIGVKNGNRSPDLEFDFRYTMDIAVDDSTGRIFVASGQNWDSKIHIFDPVIYPDTGEIYYVHVKDIDFPFNTAQSLMVMNDPHPLSPNENSLFVVERPGPHGSFVVFDNDGENPQQFKFYPEDFEHIEDPRGFKTPFGIAVNPLTDQIAISMSGFDTVVALGSGSSGSSSNNNNNIGGSNDYDYLTAPTFGLPHDTRSSPESRLIDSGISLNGLALDVGSFHTEFAKQILQTGQDNILSTKVKTSTGGYGGLKIIEFFYGVPHIGALSQAEGSIEVHIDPYDRGEFPEITDMAIRDDKHSLLLQGNTTATVQRVDCINGDAKKGCYKIDIGFVFANAPVGEVFALQATDSRGWSTTEYFNDGFEVQGAPLIPATMSIAADLARGAGKGSTEVTQIDRKKDLWLSTADNTTLYTKNDFGFWKKLTPDKPLNRCSQDTEYDTKEWNVMTRMHCLHGAQTESEAKRAQSVFNSSAIQKELPPGSFAHEPPLTIDHRSALLHKLGWITTDDVIKRIELSGKYDHMDGQQLKDEVHQLLLLEDKDADDADAVNIADASNADTGAAALVASGQSTAVIDKINSEITSLKEQFEAHSLILAQIHSALADLSDVLTQQKQELEIYSSSESELLGAMLQQQQQQQYTLLYFLPLLSAALAAVPCLFYFRRYAKAKAKTVQVMTGEQQQQKLKSYDNNNAKSQLQQMQQKLEEKHQKLKQELEEKHQKTQQTQHEKLQQTQQRLEELQESKQKLQESEHEKLQQTQQKLEELQESKQQMQQELEEKHQKLKQELEERHQKLQQTQQEKLQQTQQRLEELQESKQQMQQELEEKHQKLQQTQQEKLQQTQQKLEELQESKQKLQESEHEKLQQTQQKLEELQESKQKMQQELEEKHQKLQQTQQEKLQQTQQKLEELQESKQKLQESEHEKLQQTQQKLEELQESKQKLQQELEEKQQEQQNTPPADLSNNAEIYKKIDDLLDQKKRK